MKSSLSTDTMDVSTRGKRRSALALAITVLEKIRSAEEDYMERVPFNLRSGDFNEATEDSIDILNDAITTLLSVYD